jgi:hypothetical protein
MSFFCFSSKKKDSISFFLIPLIQHNSLEKEAKFIGERTQVTLDDQIYISSTELFAL